LTSSIFGSRIPAADPTAMPCFYPRPPWDVYTLDWTFLRDFLVPGGVNTIQISLCGRYGACRIHQIRLEASKR
jgi:hypothetical protein